MSPTTVDDILEPYDKLISIFHEAQQVEWTRWSGILPQRVTNVINAHIESGRKVNFWQNVSYFCIILSAAIPIIVVILVEVLALSHLASLLDAVFPAITAIVQKKLSSWSKKRYILASVYSPYQLLLSNVIIDIYQGEYNENSEKHMQKWEDLDQTLLNADLTL